MKQLHLITIISLLCIVGLSACDSALTDLDKNLRNPMQAVEALYNELPQGDMKILKEAVKFKENDKLSDNQKNEFFEQLKQKHFKVTAKKAKVRDGYTEVVCDITLSDGTIKEKKFKLYKEDNVWKTEIGFSEIQDAIYK
ncbi:MAG: hypothetical protein J6X70_05255 [Muribaculaceae bacterium]|nr:hypothetical protein [Muribaculaceae bacterium]